MRCAHNSGYRTLTNDALVRSTSCPAPCRWISEDRRPDGKESQASTGQWPSSVRGINGGGEHRVRRASHRQLCVCVSVCVCCCRPGADPPNTAIWLSQGGGCRGTSEEEIQEALKVRPALASPAPQSGRVDEPACILMGHFWGKRSFSLPSSVCPITWNTAGKQESPLAPPARVSRGERTPWREMRSSCAIVLKLNRVQLEN